MNVLSLFDGIACGYEALKRANIKVDKYYASEIDKYAIQVSTKNHPDIIQLGDVRELDKTTLPKIDLLIGGSPCQDLSIAKKDRKGLDGERSGLFWEYVKVLNQVKPTYFLLENVASMSKTDKETITEIMGVEPILINSALVSGQQRKRLYWTNIPGVTQPEDKGIKLADVLENGMATEIKSYCITSSYKSTAFSDRLKRHNRSIVAVPTKNQQKSNCITATYAKTSLNDDLSKQSKTTVAEPIGCAFRSWPRNTKENRIRNHLEIRKDDKSNCLTNNAMHSMICEPIRVGEFGKGGQGDRIYSVQGKSVCLSANGGGKGAKTGLYKIDLPDGDYYIRKLTPLECERLQTLDDGYTDVGISNTQRYKCVGNAWTVDIIAHIFSFMDKESKNEIQKKTDRS